MRAYTDICDRGADKWFKNLEDLTLPIFKRQENTHVGIDPLPKQVRIAILDTGTKPRWEYRDQVYEKSKNFVSGECAQKYDKDETGHGTAVAYQVARTCPNAMLYIARVAKYNDESGKPVPDKQAVVKALQWASREEVDIIIMSFGWEIQDDGDGVEDELDNIKNKKSILMFAASTNGGALGKMLFPARHCGVIAVDAFDGFGKELPTTGTPDNDCKRERFAAPGNYLFAGGDKRVTGSSYACPIVAGIAGLVIEACRREMPRPEGSIYKRLETREAMEAILKLLSTPTGNFNFLTPWENLTWHNPCQTFFFCRTIIEGPMRPYLNTGASFMEKGNKWISLMEQTVIG
ncbi:hypothetical protein CUC08_Gglean007771 [Alternaria sp. MG1]|nr:hypothetical protein CUC08_Gglean007771 [Alternaria sp. MG1]